MTARLPEACGQATASAGVGLWRAPRAVYVVPLLVALYLVLYFFLGERVPVNNGLGFDGYFYGRLAADFLGVMSAKVPSYYLDRILPSLVVWLSAQALHVPLISPRGVISAFHIYNSVLLAAAALAWVRISRVLQLSSQAALVGAACLFLNWLVSKQYLYFVVQTDATALSLGVIAALCVVERRWFSLAAVAFVASFAFKLVMPMALLLVVFPRPAAPQSSATMPRSIAALCAVLAGAAAVYVTLFLQFSLRAGADQVDISTLPISIPIVMAYSYWVARSFPFVWPPRLGALGSPGPIVLFVALWAVRGAILMALAHYFVNDVQILDLVDFAMGTVATAVAKPGVFLLAHVATFGPGIILLLVHLRRTMRAAAAVSLGSLLLLGATLVLALNSESRILAFGYPLLVVFLSAALHEIGISRRFAVLFIACSFVLSRCYLPLNAVGMATIGTGTITDIRALLEFPWQWLFMNVGPYMGWIGYAVNLAMALLATALLFVRGSRSRAA